ncbi:MULTISPECIES: D-alanyl-D-alanine carboxypeptidase/D-alanyl-D-alanine-endopeptidase [Halomonadaceae]|uniref:D-alanyl-D-alanine carboxypeptidase/D-alanyl-D-alanine endopeptidase n=1 Tax=Halomonadaceae TaxID=28256 RepID=UPI00159B1113|nr:MULTISPECIES: D-alanyl-D-alanine carboxypeptidase/D-alanyl-D-alanine-endopeptidase [Halomonas]QJQ95013.1 D-alanyl-D-alanine carboxypeptidase/D-alanyl-D-alanine-endopeptidase [Halomonas sp. PA5]
MSRLLIALLCLLPLSAHVQSQAAGFPQLSRLTDNGFLISAEARLLGDATGPGEVLGRIEPDRQLSPASVTKIYLSAAALERWGPQHRFTTRLVTTGNVDGEGILQGDLILEGGGDPGLVSEDLWRLAQQLRQRGIRGINGQLVVSQWRFGPMACITTDRCETRERSTNTYSALLSSAGVNHGHWCMSVMPAAQAGAPARVASCDTVEPLTRVTNQVTTVASGATELSAERTTDALGDTMVLRGQIVLGASPRELYRASSDPALQTAQVLGALLSQAGIEVADGHVTTTERPSTSARELASLAGRPLQELLLATMNYSNNYMADVLSLNMVAEPQGSLLQAGEALERYVAGLPGHGPVALQSGSGLTTGNRTSATGVNALLEHVYHRAALFPSLSASMQAPINGPMRFTRRGSERFQNGVMIKTGTLNQPISVRAIGGYFRTDSGQWGVFSALVNGTSQTPYLTWGEVLDPLAADLDEMIRGH